MNVYFFQVEGLNYLWNVPSTCFIPRKYTLKSSKICFVECIVINIKAHWHSETTSWVHMSHACPPYLLHSSLACSRWVKRTGQTSCEDWCSPFSRHHSLSSCCNCCNLKLWTEGSFLLWNQLYAGPALKQQKPHSVRTEARAQLHRVKQNPTFLTLKEITSSKSGAYHTQAGVCQPANITLKSHI